MLTACTAVTALAQALEGTIELAPPHPNDFDYYRDLADNGDLFISLTNTGAAAREIYVLATIRRGGGVFAAMDPAFRPTVPIRLEPLDTRDFDGGTLRELNLRFTRDDITGVNATELDAILRYRMLPPAEYSLCISAYDFATGARININGAPEICTVFEIADPGYAELLTPEHNEVIDAVDGDEDVFISWAYNGFSGGYDIRYRLKIVDLTEQAVLPELATIELMSSGVPAIYETDDFGLGELSYTYGFDATDYRLVPGHQYAVRVTAFEADGRLVFPQGGHSQVHVFTYGRAAGGTGDCASPDYSLTARYPLTGDTIPFNFTPCVAQVEPLCDEYRRFDFNFTLSQNGGPTYSRADRNVWTRLGPHGYLEDLLGQPVTRERASHFVFNLETEQTGAIGPLEAGGNYTWNTSSTMRSATGADYRGASAPQNFVHGMPRPRLASPADGEVIAPGTVNLVWQSGQAPGQLLPEHLNLIRAERSEVVGYESVGSVFEACVVQVARGREFSEAEMIGGQKIDLRLTDLDQSTGAIAAALYREMSFSVSATDTGTYYWRVVWLKDITYTVGANGYLAAGRSYHDSPIRRFRIDTSGRTGGDPEPPVATTPDDSECESTCVTDLPASTSPRSILLVGDSIRLGRFTLVPTEVSGDGSGFSGSGTIHMPFMNDLRVMVNFSGIRINGAGQAFTGSAKAVQDPMPFDIIAGTGLGSANPVPSVSPDQLGLLNAAISGTERLVSALTDRRAIGLPLGFDRELGGYQAILGIVAMDFTPTAADLDIVCSLELPEFGGYIGLGIGDWCFKPSGLGTDGRLYVPQDIPLNPGEDIVFKISGGPASDSTNITYAEFDCSGMTCLQLRGELEFDRSIILPDTTTITDPDAKVTASLRAKVCVQDGFDLLVESRMPSFIAPGADNFTWEESQLWVDLSDRENPTGMDVPTGYRWPAAGRARDTWKGIYIPRVMMRLPDQLDGDEAGLGTTVGVDHFIVDFRPAAISFRVAAYNVVGEREAHIDGWGLTIDTLYAALIQTRDLEAGIVGRIQMPIADTGTHLLYRAALNTRGIELGVSVDPARPFGVPIMAAQLTLKPNTFLKIALPFGSSPYIEAQLNGTVTITGEQADQFAGGSSSEPGMNLPGVRFDDVYFHTGSGTSRPGTWAFASPQKQAAGFPLSIEDMGLDLSDWEHPGFFIRPRLTIMSGSPGIAGEAELRFYGIIDTEASGIKKIGLDRVALTEISIEANISKVKLAGYIRWRKTGNVDEVAGGLDVSIPMGIRGKMACTFGTYQASPTATFNTAEYFSYWHVNGILQFDPGLQIFSGFALYGLGGGVSYHMERRTAASFSEIRLSPKLAGGDSTTVVDNVPNPSSATYARDFTKGLGLELTVMLGTYPKADVFNMDVSLRAMFLPAGGLARFEIEGDGYVMTAIDDRESDSKMVWASVDFLYDATQDLVDGRFKVFLDVKSILVGQHPDKSVIDAHFYSSPVKWFFQVGTYATPGGIKFVVGDRTPGRPAELPHGGSRRAG